MKEIRVVYQFVVFLCAYLNQIDLSLDRSRWVSIIELREYYENQISPEKVADYLLERYGLKARGLQCLYYIGEISFTAKVKGMFLRYFKQESFLTKDEMYYCCQKLLLLNQYLKSDVEIHKLEIEKLRLEFSKLLYGSLVFKLSTKDKDKAMSVEHFLQNEHLNLISIKTFASGLEI